MSGDDDEHVDADPRLLLGRIEEELGVRDEGGREKLLESILNTESANDKARTKKTDPEVLPESEKHRLYGEDDSGKIPIMNRARVVASRRIRIGSERISVGDLEDCGGMQDLIDAELLGRSPNVLDKVVLVRCWQEDQHKEAQKEAVLTWWWVRRRSTHRRASS